MKKEYKEGLEMARKDYPMGSISSGTMRKEDLIPAAEIWSMV